MKKKLAILLSLCFAMLVLGACTTDPTTVDYNGVSYDELKSYTENISSTLAGYSNDELDSLISSGNLDDAKVELVQKWEDTITDEVGSYEGNGKFTIDKSGNTLTTTLRLLYSKRDVEFQVVINYNDMTITGYTLEPVYSLGEKMQKAGLNTLISITIVFAVLIVISLIISCFKIFPYLENKKKESAKALSSAEDQVVSQIEQREEQQLTDDTELVAVIAAAIAASTGTSTSDFVVRSINRR